MRLFKILRGEVGESGADLGLIYRLRRQAQARGPGRTQVELELTRNWVGRGFAASVGSRPPSVRGAQFGTGATGPPCAGLQNAPTHMPTPDVRGAATADSLPLG